MPSSFSLRGNRSLSSFDIWTDVNTQCEIPERNFNKSILDFGIRGNYFTAVQIFSRVFENINIGRSRYFSINTGYVMKTNGYWSLKKKKKFKAITNQISHRNVKSNVIHEELEN